MFNRVIFMGNLTRDPELRYTPQGTPVASLGLAVTSRIKQGEEWKDEVLFIDISVFGKIAENCGEYLSKGSGILVEGRLQENKWEADGQQKSKMRVVAQTVKFLPKRSPSEKGPFEKNEKNSFEKQSPVKNTKSKGSYNPPPDEMTDIEPF
ncbi:MAG: single-stranded DNA-binding protein [Nitrospirae bacterium]|nr:single-stranded DNA-binding protein [Nitrospirota bacterium]